jgi:hypothetical protein
MVLVARHLQLINVSSRLRKYGRCVKKETKSLQCSQDTPWWQGTNLYLSIATELDQNPQNKAVEKTSENKETNRIHTL